jgi:hypothetical protein
MRGPCRASYHGRDELRLNASALAQLPQPMAVGRARSASATLRSVAAEVLRRLPILARLSAAIGLKQIAVGYCFAQTITAFAPSQLAPVVPTMCAAAPPAQ